MNKNEIKLASCRRVYVPQNICMMDEVGGITLHPQANDGMHTFRPEKNVLIENNERFFIMIHLALCDNGRVYSRYEVFTRKDAFGGYPNLGWTSGRDVKEAIRKELEELRDFQENYGDPPDPEINRIVDSSIHKLKIRSLRQFTIFDYLD